MNDWVSCANCKTLYEYDPVRRIAECPYCKKRADDQPARDDRAREAPRETERAGRGSKPRKS